MCNYAVFPVHNAEEGAGADYGFGIANFSITAFVCSQAVFDAISHKY